MTIYSDKVPGQQFPVVEEQVLLGYNKASKIAWLDLRNTPFLLHGSREDGVQRFLIGAVNKPGKGWEPIQGADATGGQLVSLTSNFSNPDEILAFQEAILLSWVKFSSGRVSEFAKGTTLFGKSLTSASFVAKALKTGFDAIRKPMATGLRVCFKIFPVENGVSEPPGWSFRAVFISICE